MTDKFESTTLLKLTTSISGGKRIPKGNDFSKEKTNYPYIRTSEINNLKLDFDKLKYISKEIQEQISRYVVEEDDIIISNVGTIGKLLKVTKEIEGFNLTENCLYIRVNEKILNSYLMYYLLSKKGINEIKINTVRTSVKKLPIKNCREIVVSYPTCINEQDKIVSILDQQQGLIDSYKEKLSLLEEQEAYYQDELLSGRLRIRLVEESINYVTQQGWYLNDDLVEGKEKHFEEWISVDFHDKVEFYKDKIYPKKKLIEFVNINLGQSPSSESYCSKEDGLDFFQGVAEFGDKYPITKKYTNSPKKIAPKESVLMSVRAPVGKLNYAKVECCIGRGLAALNSKDNEYLYFLLNYHKNDWKRIQKGAIFPAVNKIDVENFEVNYPDFNILILLSKNILRKLNNQKELIKEKIKIEEEKMDYLMDELLSGRIRVQ